jgi:hypothetical protein
MQAMAAACHTNSNWAGMAPECRRIEESFIVGAAPPCGGRKRNETASIVENTGHTAQIPRVAVAHRLCGDGQNVTDGEN